VPSKPVPSRPVPSKQTQQPAADELERDGLNLVVVRGTVSSPPDVRVLPSAAVLVQLQVSTRLANETLSLPVAGWSPAGWVESLEPGADVVVVGRVRRRFFQAAGAAASRVEVEAELVARARDRRRVQAAVRRAVEALEVLDE